MEAILETAKSIAVVMAEIVLAIYFCRQYINKATEKLPMGPAVKKQNEIDLDIISKMDYYKELLNADRVLLFEFHNGQHYSNYRSALKMSASYEVYRAGLESSREKCTNLPIAIMPKFIKEITQQGYSKCVDIEDIRYDMGNSYEFKKSIGIQSFYDIAIRDKANNVIGFVAVQWNTKMPENIDGKMVEHLAWYLEECIKQLMINEAKIKENKSSWLFKK